MHKFSKAAAAALLLMMLTGLLAGCGGDADAPAAAAATAPTAAARQVPAGYQTILLASLEPYEPAAGTGFRNQQKADMLMLMILDEAGKKTTYLQLNPDTMVPFTLPASGETRQMPLGQVFSYGSGGSDSGLNLMKAVSKLLEGLTIQHYMLFTLDSIDIVTDLLGGVEVEIRDSFPSQYPELVQGQTVLLSGGSASAFFQYRSDDDISNEAHMGRQQQYITGSYIPFSQRMQQDNFLTKLTVQLGDRLSTDLTLSQMAAMMELLAQCTLDETIHTLPGSASLTDGQFQFQAEADGIRQALDALLSG